MSNRVPYIDQGHHVLSLFRQQTDAEIRAILAAMLESVERRRPKTTNGSKEAEANDKLQQMLPHLIRQSEEITPYQLGHIAIDWGHLDLTTDLRKQFGERHTERASEGRRKVGEPVRDAARTDIRANPKTTLGACARRVAKALERDDPRPIERMIRPLFEWSPMGDGRRQKRPRPIDD